MDGQLFTSLTTILTGVLGVAFLSVLVSRNANTAGVASSLFTGLAQDINAAVSPVSGGGLGNLGSFNSANFNINGIN